MVLLFVMFAVDGGFCVKTESRADIDDVRMVRSEWSCSATDGRGGVVGVILGEGVLRWRGVSFGYRGKDVRLVGRRSVLVLRMAVRHDCCRLARSPYAAPSKDAACIDGTRDGYRYREVYEGCGVILHPLPRQRCGVQEARIAEPQVAKTQMRKATVTWSRWWILQRTMFMVV